MEQQTEKPAPFLETTEDERSQFDALMILERQGAIALIGAMRDGKRVPLIVWVQDAGDKVKIHPIAELIVPDNGLSYSDAVGSPAHPNVSPGQGDRSEEGGAEQEATPTRPVKTHDFYISRAAQSEAARTAMMGQVLEKLDAVLSQHPDPDEMPSPLTGEMQA